MSAARPSRAIRRSKWRSADAVDELRREAFAHGSEPDRLETACNSCRRPLVTRREPDVWRNTLHKIMAASNVLPSVLAEIDERQGLRMASRGRSSKTRKDERNRSG
jgi:hypothetical protein